MKRILAPLLTVIMLVTPFGPALAASQSMSFFEALSNLSHLQNYKISQSFFGTAEIADNEDHLNVEYRITVNSDLSGSDSNGGVHRISALVRFKNPGDVTESVPFKTMTVRGSAELITIGQEAVYAKLDNFGVKLKKPLQSAVEDIKNVESIVGQFQGIWFHSALKELATEGLQKETQKSVDVDKYLALGDEFKKDPEQGILELARTALSDSNADLTETETNNVLDGLKTALETKLFTTHTVSTGENTGSEFFSLNKTALVDLAGNLGKIFGQELSDDDVTMLRSALSKLNLSGVYHTDEANNLIDDLLVRLQIKNTETVKNLELNYRYKVTDVNIKNSISAPTDFQEWGGEPQTEPNPL